MCDPQTFQDYVLPYCCTVIQKSSELVDYIVSVREAASNRGEDVLTRVVLLVKIFREKYGQLLMPLLGAVWARMVGQLDRAQKADAKAAKEETGKKAKKEKVPTAWPLV
eukprot:TRINITY_DN3603_c0_g1_i1.p1 TRINITY_DN3603_c0_g1~~TRINITY_DN3603_c0_g1_i1.p1  ORF type:complete len:109 (+),score=23.81 TRINITY_DN3603_c0_g1_i1:218-544(+)